YSLVPLSRRPVPRALLRARGAPGSPPFPYPTLFRSTSQAWRTALDPEGEWMPAVLSAADRRLSEIRHHVPDAGGLVLATDQTVRSEEHTSELQSRAHLVCRLLPAKQDTRPSLAIVAS